MKKIIISCILCLISTFAFGETLVVTGKSYSLLLNDALINMNGTQVKYIFTTYDGNRSAYPYYHDAKKGILYYSREMKKIGNLYYTDYYSIINGIIDDYGEISLNFGSIDSDNNGIDDICETEKGINTNIMGNWYSHTGETGTISGTVVRNKYSRRGFLNLLIKNTWAGDIASKSDFYTGVLSGTAIYSKPTNSIIFSYKTTWLTDCPVSNLQTSFKMINNDTIKILGKDFFPTTDFIRSDNTYSATVQLHDSDLDTFWPDYQKWHITIKDTIDSNKNGIPNFSDIESRKSHLPFLPLLLEEE
jgi:hypothetical protein